MVYLWGTNNKAMTETERMLKVLTEFLKAEHAKGTFSRELGEEEDVMNLIMCAEGAAFIDGKV